MQRPGAGRQRPLTSAGGRVARGNERFHRQVIRGCDGQRRVMRRFDLVFGMMDEVVANIEQVQAEGEGQLAQLLDLILVGDFTSLQLALNEGVDPGPVPALDEIKMALAEGEPATANEG